MLHIDEVKSEAANFQTQRAHVVTPEQKTKVLALARDLPRVWRAATTQSKDRKRMLRLLIRDITVEKLADARQVVLHVRWQGGACTDTTVPLPSPIADQMLYPRQIIERIRELSNRLSNPQIVQALNQEGLRSPRGLPITQAMIKWIRIRYAVPSVCLMRPEELTAGQLADRLSVSVYFVRYWIKRGVIDARHLGAQGPWWITITDQQEQQLRDRIRTSGHLKNHRETLPDAYHPNTQS
ncbi:hypothetical protein LJR084_007283 [Variovorax sp. LjRoot84]|uniref:hypothetical protein n=1 Tax=Variovorax sp. LjRoot84 TaxID=3342340 RepID=UPI003ECF21CB